MQKKVGKKDLPETTAVFNEVAAMIHSLSVEDIEKVRKQSKSKVNAPAYINLFEAILEEQSYSQIAKTRANPENILYLLHDLKDKIIELTIPSERAELYHEILKIENAFRLDLKRDAYSKLKVLESKLSKKDFWLQWRILDLRWQYLNKVENADNTELFRLYQILYHSHSLIDKDLEKFIKENLNNDFLNFILLYKKQIDLTNLTIKQSYQLLEKLSSNSFSFFDFNNADSAIKHIEFSEWFTNAYLLLQFMVKNNLFINTYNQSAIHSLSHEIKLFRETINPFDLNILPNSFVLYLEYILLNLETCLVLFNEEINIKDISANSDLSYLNIEDVVTRIEILKIISKLFQIDIYNRKVTAVLEAVFKEVALLLNKNKEINLSPDNESGLQCIYILITKVLKDTDINKSGRTSRYKLGLRKHPFYSYLIDEKKDAIEKLEPATFMQLACLKLNSAWFPNI